jgi:predicted membrane protein
MVGYLCTGYYIESDALVTFIGLHELFRIPCILDVFWVSAHSIGSEITLKFLFFRKK